MSEQARYLQQCRVALVHLMRRYGPLHKHTKFWLGHCQQEAGYLISGASGLWGAK